ncbi:MAG: hypothetical protein JRJ65_04860 [Deltaproteobacteria bacterium]|nr:hypothetical protein [Deltaproteobacteria bacterium]
MTPKPEKSVSRLTTALALEPREHLALVGGGGKTSLMFALAEELRLTRKRVVTSTTTKIRHREALSSLCVIVLQTDSSWRDKLRSAPPFQMSCSGTRESIICSWRQMGQQGTP